MNLLPTNESVHGRNEVSEEKINGNLNGLKEDVDPVTDMELDDIDAELYGDDEANDIVPKRIESSQPTAVKGHAHVADLAKKSKYVCLLYGEDGSLQVIIYHRNTLFFIVVLDI